MQLTDRAILLTLTRYSEHAAVVHALTESHGLYSGLAKGALGKTHRGTFQPGNIIQLTWKARLPEHMGTISAELAEPLAAYLLPDALGLAALQSAAALITRLLPERMAYNSLFTDTLALLRAMSEGREWLPAYVRFELDLLEISGYGLDLAQCAATGSVEELQYVSPRTGRAVSGEAGRPYHEKLFALPTFLLPNRSKTVISHVEMLDGLRLTGYFLESRALAAKGRKMPQAAIRLRKLLEPARAISVELA